MSYITQRMQAMREERCRIDAACRAEREAEEAALAEAVKRQVPPLIDQLRLLLATMTPAETNRISINAIVPRLRGKYREQPNHVHVARALRQLGYACRRSYVKADGGNGKRLWHPNTN